MIEKVWRTLGGRKFVGFVVASWLCYVKAISDQVWMIAFVFFVAANVAQKFLLQRGGAPGVE